jgi:hypothetical protein
MLYIPICAIAWRRIGYEPIILIVRDPDIGVGTVANKTIEYLNLFKIRIVYVSAQLDYIDQLGMLARIYACTLPDEIINEDDFLITSDSDLIPVNKNFFNFYNTKAITILNAFCCHKIHHDGKAYDMFPMSYIGMRKWQWREVMKIPNGMKLNGENMMSHLKKKYTRAVFRKNNETQKGDDVWYLDQITVTIAINEYVNDEAFRHRRKLNKFYFGPRFDRIDPPEVWYEKLKSADQMIDAHMYHGDVKPHAKIIFDFFEKLFNKNIIDRLRTYFNEVFSLLQNSKIEG